MFLKFFVSIGFGVIDIIRERVGLWLLLFFEQQPLLKVHIKQGNIFCWSVPNTSYGREMTIQLLVLWVVR